MSRIAGRGRERVRLFRLDLDREYNGRFPTDHVFLDAGRYVLEASDTVGAYTPFSPSSQGRSPHWFHEVHLALVPLDDATAPVPASARHVTVRNREAPGPHVDRKTAYEAFRAIPEAERSFVVGERSSLAIWIPAGEYGDWEPRRYAYGTLWLELWRVEA